MEFANFGKMLEHLRRHARLTQEELARAVGYSREQITKLENNQRTPNPATVKALFISALDLAPDSDLAARLIELAGQMRSNEDRTTASTVPSRTNLTTPLTRFIGREREIAEISAHLFPSSTERADRAVRLLALTGAGGVGKTRLAIQVGLELLTVFSDGVWWVELAPLNDPALVAETIAAALHLSVQGQTAEDALTARLHDKKLLLILDNCEHLLVACAQLAEKLLSVSPQLRILATSRETLGILSAMTWHVPSLSLPSQGAGSEWDESVLLDSEAVRLFVDRATLSKPDFALTPENAQHVVAICRRLEGVPLAIELAAIRVRAMSIEQISERLSDRFRLLTGGNATALPRHRTLRAMIDWSYDLLSESERRLLLQLGIFVGGWHLEAAEAIYGVDALELLLQLIDKSLVDVDEYRQETRYSLLETIREYTLEKLVQAHGIEDARTHHLDYYASFAERNEQRLYGEQQKLWYERFDVEQDNFRAALDWAIRSGNATAGLRLIGSLWQYWFWRGHWSEGTRWARGVFTLVGETDVRLRGRALIGASNLAGNSGDYATSNEWFFAGRALAENANDTALIAQARLTATFSTGDYAQACALFTEARGLAQAASDRWLEANVLSVWGDRTRDIGDMASAEKLYIECVRLLREIGEHDLIANPLGNLGRIAFDEGDYLRAQAAYEESIVLARDMNNKPRIANWLLQLAIVALQSGDADRAHTALHECLPICYQIGNQAAIADCFIIAANLANAHDLAERSAVLLGAADRVLEQFSQMRQLVERRSLANITRTLEATQTRLNEAVFRPAWEKGHALSTADAVAFALAES